MARRSLWGANIPIAAVTNFPHGNADPERAADETAAAVDEGAEEIDVVFPYRALLAGDRQIGRRLVEATRRACGDRVLLKVILESGQLTPGLIREASEAAIESGAHFLKTSTGKTQPGATLEAASIMLDTIAESGIPGLGFKASGGVRTIAEAKAYLDLFEQRFGAGSAVATNFRIGASALMTEVILRLG